MTIAVANLKCAPRRLHVLFVAPVAEVVSTEAAVESSGAAVHALPVDLLFAMLFAVLLTGTVSFHLASFAPQILFFCVFFDAKL